MTVWAEAKQIIGSERLTLGPQASDQWLNAPDHLAMVLARYRAAAALIGDADSVIEFGCGEGIGYGILKRGRVWYSGLDLDADAIRYADEMRRGTDSAFLVRDILECPQTPLGRYPAVVSLDVIEHIPAAREDHFMENIVDTLEPFGVCVIGTPNAAFEHLASLQSKAGHINLYTHERLHALMSRYFMVVQSFGLQDTSLHLGHPDARHYLLFCGVGPRRPV